MRICEEKKTWMDIDEKNGQSLKTMGEEKCKKCRLLYPLKFKYPVQFYFILFSCCNFFTI